MRETPKKPQRTKTEDAETMATAEKKENSEEAAKLAEAARAAKKNSKVAAARKSKRMQAQKPDDDDHSLKIHIVRKGDTLIEIARRYRVPLRLLASHNQIKSRSKVLVGARLEIP